MNVGFGYAEDPDGDRCLRSSTVQGAVESHQDELWVTLCRPLDPALQCLLSAQVPVSAKDVAS